MRGVSLYWSDTPMSFLRYMTPDQDMRDEARRAVFVADLEAYLCSQR